MSDNLSHKTNEKFTYTHSHLYTQTHTQEMARFLTVFSSLYVICYLRISLFHQWYDDVMILL